MKYKGSAGRLAGTGALFALACLFAAAGCGDIGPRPVSLPSGFLLTAPSDSSTIVGVRPTVTWTNATGETRYYVEFDTDTSFTSPAHYTASVNADKTSYTVLSSTLSASTRYYWRVRAINSAGPTTASNAPFSFMTTWSSSTLSGFELRLPADGATGVGVTPTLAWGDHQDETLYYVEWDEDPLFSTKVTYTVAADTTSYGIPVSALTPSTTYYWQVRAITPAGPVTAPNAPFSFTP